MLYINGHATLRSLLNKFEVETLNISTTVPAPLLHPEPQVSEHFLRTEPLGHGIPLRRLQLNARSMPILDDAFFRMGGGGEEVGRGACSTFYTLRAVSMRPQYEEGSMLRMVFLSHRADPYITPTSASCDGCCCYLARMSLARIIYCCSYDWHAQCYDHDYDH